MSAFGVDAFDAPLVLAALAGLALLLGLAALRAAAPALPWPALAEGIAAGARRLDPVRLVSVSLRVGALAALAAVLAGPVGIQRAPASTGEGLDLVLAVDVSGSMRALDAEVDGEAKTRVALAREVVARFARERAADGDRVGLVVFGDFAFTQCPLTSDGALLADAVLRVDAGMAGEATALGDGLALAVKRVVAPRTRGASAERANGVERASGTGRPNRGDDLPGADGGGGDPTLAEIAPGGEAPILPEGAPAPAAGRLVVLLTDGRSNAGAVPTDVAASLARAHGVRVHAVGIGSEGAVAMADGGGGRVHFERHDLDVATLERIAGASGGRLFRARTSRDLAAVYKEIDALERVSRDERPRVRRSPRPEPLLAAAGGLVLLEIALARILARRLP